MFVVVSFWLIHSKLFKTVVHYTYPVDKICSTIYFQPFERSIYSATKMSPSIVSWKLGFHGD